MGIPHISTLWHYARAALMHPRKAIAKSGLIASRISRRVSVKTSPRLDGLALRTREGLDTLLEDLGTRLPVLVLTRGPRVAHIGMPVDLALSTLNALAEAGRDVDVFVDGRRTGSATRATQDAIVRAGHADVVFRGVDGEHNILTIDLYEDRGARLWVSFNETNTTARALYDWDFDKTGLRDLPRPIAETQNQTAPVDVVFTWVNHADPDWQTLFANAQNSTDGTTDGGSITRFRDNGELRYALRSVARFMPWVRHIYVVSNCAPPPWMRTAAPNITWVDHADILPADALPTFNSHAIETALHHIADLSEEFIYFNDDMIVMRPLNRSWFFGENGTTRAHMEPFGMVTGVPAKGSPDYLNAARVGAELIARQDGKWPTQLHQHVPYALRRSVLAELETQFPDAIGRTQLSAFRAPDNVSMTSFLYHHFAWHRQSCVFDVAHMSMIKSADLRWRDDLAKVKGGNFDVICLNEGGRTASEPQWQKAITRTLSGVLPWPAPWEKDATDPKAP